MIIVSVDVFLNRGTLVSLGEGQHKYQPVFVPPLCGLLLSEEGGRLVLLQGFGFRLRSLGELQSQFLE